MNTEKHREQHYVSGIFNGIAIEEANHSYAQCNKKYFKKMFSIDFQLFKHKFKLICLKVLLNKPYK